MNFKDLREADLSKAQIKKVHDKADEMPKSDFIKRYGKDGDSVRFATATNMVKKQLNIEALDKEDEKSIGDVVKGLKKAVKSHQAQVKSLTKDIQDQVSNEGGPGSGPQHGEITITKNGKSKKVKRPALSIFKKAGWKQEEVVTEAVSDGQVAQAKRMTDKNDHFGARKYLASIIRDKEMMQMYDSLEKMHRMDLGGNDALTLRSKLDKNLKFRLTQKLKKDADRLMDAL